MENKLRSRYWIFYEINRFLHICIIWSCWFNLQYEFIDNGAEMMFIVGDLPAVIRSSSSTKEVGLTYTLYVDDVEITEQNLESSLAEND